MAKARNSTGSSPFTTVICILCVLTIVNIIYFNVQAPGPVRKCSTDAILHAAAMYISNDRASTIMDLLPSDCPWPSIATQTDIDSAVTNVVKQCRMHSQAMRKMQVSSPLITLFTTHAAHNHKDEEKLTVHNNTIQNWASFHPYVKAVLFSNDTEWANIAREAGWDVLSLEQNNHTNTENDTEVPPILKNMFTKVMHTYDTPLYGYVNADILFSDNFLDTVLFITKHFDINQSIFITGQRTNVENITHVDLSSKKNIQHAADTVGTLYRIDAEDFFFTTKSFPWEHIIPVVVGRVGYDNWLVSYARCSTNSTVIDATESVTAVHQTTAVGGNQEGHFHNMVNYNHDVFKRHLIKPDFGAGLTPCAEYRTYINFCDAVALSKRGDTGNKCACDKKI